MAKKIASAPSNLKSKISNPQSLRVLMVEDSEDDALLIIRELKKGGYNPVCERVETAAAMKKALKDKQWDIILCDYKLPKFSGEQAIALLKETNIEIPLIIVSGTIGEETAVECMRSGAHDYIMKNNLSRLCPAIAREIEEAKVRNKQRQAENALRRSEENFRLSLDDSPLGIRIVTAESETLYANQAVLKMYGYESIEELRKTPLKERYTPESYAKFQTRKEKRGRGEFAPSEYDINIVRKNGEIWHIQVFRKEVIWNGARQFQIIYQDITERKRAEEALRQSEELYRTIFENTGTSMILIEEDMTISMANGEFVRNTGYSLDEINGRLKWTEIVHPDDLGRMIKQHRLRRESQGGALPGYELRYITKTGNLRDALLNIQLVPGTKKSVASLMDITERKQAEKKLINSEEKFRTLAESSPFAIMMHQGERWIYANRAAQEISGYTEEELYRMHFWDFVHPDHRNMGKKRGLDRQQGKVLPPEYELKIIAKNGVEKWVSLTGNTIQHEDKPTALISVTDITERKLAQEEMVRKSEEIADLYNNAPCGYHSLGTDGTILRINDTELEWLGYNRDEVTGKKKWTDFLTPAGCLIFKKTFPIIKNQKWIKGIEYKLVRKDGSVFPVLLNATAVIDEKGNYVESRSICFDITERKQGEEERRRLEAELFQSQKMEAVGTLAGGIAHDLNNILGGILGYTELVLTTHITQDHPARKYMDGVMRGIDRACDLVSHINTFSRQEEKERKLIGLGPVIKEALKLIKATLPAKIEMRQRITDVERTVFADPTQMHQVVMNLCTNATHAMKEKGGILDVSLSQITFGADDAVFHPDLKTGIEYELLIVRDTGAGINPENIGRIFDPFFTTKKPGEGTGLGLSVVYGIIKSHDGVICIESEPGQGSTFRVYIPTIIAAREEKNKQIDEAMPGGSERIMFVDDETALTTIFKIQFESLGYSVDIYNDPLEALAAFQKEPQDFALVTTDMAMPHMTGIDLDRELTKIRPDLPVILCTGAVEELDQELLRSLGVRRLILKPIFTKDLARAVRQVLDGEDQD